jgi:Family of unknown function (DUF6879)
MLERIADLPGERLDPKEYAADARMHFEEIADAFWKLERRQAFQERDDVGYDAFMRGEWERAVRIEEETRASVLAYYEKIAKLGFEGRRVRIVESPVSPYLQWEMQALRIRAEAGERIRVVDAGAVSHLEKRHPLPEAVILGTRVLYEVLYDTAGVHCGARRIEDREVIARCRTELSGLWEVGEELMTYVTREIAPLPPPPPQR